MTEYEGTCVGGPDAGLTRREDQSIALATRPAVPGVAASEVGYYEYAQGAWWWTTPPPTTRRVLE